MTDKLRAALVTGELTYHEVLVDMGNGTYALKVVAVNESGAAALTDAQLRASSVPVLDKNGMSGVTNTTGTGAVTGTFTKIQIITDTIFTTLTEAGATGSLGTTIIPAGMTIFGQFSAYQLTSGVVRAYA